jgi:membrane-bound lytic murein transglycosylase MltF
MSGLRTISPRAAVAVAALIPLVPLALAIGGCRSEAPGAQPAAAGQPSPPPPGGAQPATEPAANQAPDPGEAPVPLQALETAELLKLTEVWTGDFDEIASGKRRFIRALVTPNRTIYYGDGLEQRGVAFESLRELERVLGEQSGKGAVKPKVVIIPTPRDRLFSRLEAGYGDIAIGGLTVTEARANRVDFSIPTLDGVRDVVVTGPGAPPIATLDDLAGRQVHVRPSSSYHEDLVTLNERLQKEGKPPVTIVPADDLLEDEDILQMVDAGVMPITVVKDFFAKFWVQVYDRLTVHDDVVLRTDGRLAWALRRNTPGFMKVVNDMVRTHRQGTVFGNVLIKRYLGSAARLQNATADEDLKRFRAAAPLFQKYGSQYGFDWLVLAAQAYQESRIDQSVKSSVGAVGVMQIKPETAADVGIKDITTIENNIHAGVKYFRFIVDQYYRDEPMERLDKGLFAFASYNAGPARIRRLRTKARDMGLDPNRWFGNVELIAGREIGRETVDYVSNIYKYYTAYKAIEAQRQLKTGAKAPATSGAR